MSALLLDASVVIDYLAAGEDFLAMIPRALGSTVIARPALLEVRNLHEERCATLGISLHTPPLELLEVAGRRRRGLSFADEICLAVAMKQRWQLVTNDAALLRRAREAGVEAVRGLAVVIRLVEAGALSRGAAWDAAQAIQRANPYFITHRVLADFRSKIGWPPYSAR